MVKKQIVFGREVKVFADRPKTITEMLNNSAAKFPDKEAVVSDKIRMTYKEAKERIDTISANLQTQFHLKKGDRIALLLNNCIEFFLMVFASAQLGAIVVPLNTKLKEKELTFMLLHSGTKLLVSESDFKGKVDSIFSKAKLPDLKQVFFVNHEDSKDTKYLPFSVLEKSTPFKNSVQVDETDPLFIVYTSGTTGTPKGAIGSHIGVIHSAMNYEKILGTNEETKTLIAVPLFHVTGLIGQMLHIVLVGGTSVIMPRYQTESYIQTAAEEKVTFLFNVPTIYIMMMSHKLFRQYDFSSVKTIAYGGAPMSYETIYQLRKSFSNASLQNAYGATETSSPTTIMPASYPDSKIESVGLPVPVADLKIVNEDLEECGPNEVGELLIKGPMVVEGYWDNDEANRTAFIDGYWISGDMARMDEEGFVYIMDRKKDMINRGGEKIFSVEVENALYNHPSVLEAAVVGVPDPVYGEQVKAFIVKKEGTEVSAEELKSFLSERLARYKIPKEIDFISELPRNPGGKVLKNILTNQ
ncbi:class I adenylate-forming enzyme family protein [Pueribacillus theae]|uniref:class I adenylate-forming enzyme family protein n=1 Tax=Pueribacillus theae TaxID=2171751 RepID=UPI001F0C5716|nr:class I adenylate-forming enzyme family protein [Pueribacillus theae]